MEDVLLLSICILKNRIPALNLFQRSYEGATTVNIGTIGTQLSVPVVILKKKNT
jgi:hypothetical protein